VFSFDSASPEAATAYRANGFVHLRSVITRAEAFAWRVAATAASERLTAFSDAPVFTQTVNVWREDEAMRRLTLERRIAQAATALAGVPLRLWHDQILIKLPNNQTPTEFHQDQPYWPHLDSPHPISCWIALGDVTVEAGCMSFIPGSQSYTELKAQNLGDHDSLFSMAPELEWTPRVTIPLKAGDCTFHHGRCAHMAGPNRTPTPRVAHVAIFMDATTRFSGGGHVVTDPLALAPHQPFDHELFPEV
jgi:phytanoyl-CoA hydroxylase